ncbi:ATP phosphoribosyltransferase regulatory subunit [Candidatus Margulisiibacteriota bacterium]
MKTLTPFGVKDLIPEDAIKQQEILDTAEKIFQKWDFQKVITPSVEYYDALAQGMGDYLNKKNH